MALAPLALVLASLEIVIALLVLHPSKVDSPRPDSLLEFQPDSNF
jgi:hypothetical protein